MNYALMTHKHSIYTFNLLQSSTFPGLELENNIGTAPGQFRIRTNSPQTAGAV
jgi:hypothetical protein